MLYGSQTERQAKDNGIDSGVSVIQGWQGIFYQLCMRTFIKCPIHFNLPNKKPWYSCTWRWVNSCRQVLSRKFLRLKFTEKSYRPYSVWLYINIRPHTSNLLGPSILTDSNNLIKSFPLGFSCLEINWITVWRKRYVRGFYSIRKSQTHWKMPFK